MNSALKVLLKRREEDKSELEEKVLLNMEELVAPYIEIMKTTRLDSRQSNCLSIIESSLKEIVSPFLRNLGLKYSGFTPKEIQVATLIKQGKTSKEIAEMFSVSTRTVKFHRGNIRAKLGLKNEKTNLGSYLVSLS
jgi:DNA-binding CsgD family transcriptional regulator